MTEAIFPLRLVKAALAIKIRDMKIGFTGPIVSVMYSRKYHGMALHFCDQAQRRAL